MVENPRQKLDKALPAMVKYRRISYRDERKEYPAEPSQRAWAAGWKSGWSSRLEKVRPGAKQPKGRNESGAAAKSAACAQCVQEVF